jgi:hypothetical protein
VPAGQVTVYSKVPVTVAACVVLPKAARLPDQVVPLAPPPLAMQPLVEDELHANEKDCPADTEAGVAVSVAVGLVPRVTTCSCMLSGEVFPAASLTMNPNWYTPVWVGAPVIAPVELTLMPGGNCPVSLNVWGNRPRASGGNW